MGYGGLLPGFGEERMRPRGREGCGLVGLLPEFIVGQSRTKDGEECEKNAEGRNGGAGGVSCDWDFVRIVVMNAYTKVQMLAVFLLYTSSDLNAPSLYIVSQVQKAQRL